MNKKQAKPTFICANCNTTHPQWVGKCSTCGEWNTLKETVPNSTAPGGSTAYKKPPTHTIISTLEEIKASIQDTAKDKYSFSSPAIHEFFTDGLAIDSLTLIAGEPGLGKSTLTLQLIHNVLKHHPTLQITYVSAEESMQEVTRRAIRLGITSNITILQTHIFEEIEKHISQHKPNILVIDSMQTIRSIHSDSAPGSVAQVTNIATELLAICKDKQICALLIGHVTKDGSIAGPRTLEHLVDSVLLLERTEQDLLTATFIKHRFGTTDNILFLRMQPSGLSIISDPSALLLENIEAGIGICYAIMNIKNQFLTVEIQALVSPNITGIGKQRMGIGISSAKLNSILAIIKKYMHIELDSSDVYVTVSGYKASLWDESVDLAVMLAVISSALDKPVTDLLKLPIKDKPVFASRVTLSGALRQATQYQKRKEVAQKLGMVFNPTIPSKGEISQIHIN